MVAHVAWRPGVGVATLKVSLGCCWAQCSEALGVRHPRAATHCPHGSRWASASAAQSGRRSSCRGRVVHAHLLPLVPFLGHFVPSWRSEFSVPLLLVRTAAVCRSGVPSGP